MDVEYSWGRIVALNYNQSWGVAVAENRVQGSSWVSKVGGDITSSDSWQEASEPTNLSSGVAAAVDSNDYGSGWGDKAGCDSPVSDNWKKASEAASNLSWGVAAAEADNKNHGIVWVGNDSQRPSVAHGTTTVLSGLASTETNSFYGTTTGAIIGNDAAYVVVESRAVSAKVGEEGLIVDGKYDKTFKLGPSILAVGAGHTEQLDQMKAAAKKAVKNGGVQNVCKVLDRFIREWKKNNKNKSFPTILTLIWSTKYEVAIRLFDGKNRRTVTEKDVLVSTGNGSGFLKEYVNECLKKKKLIVDDDYLSCLCEGLVYSCTRSKSSGGIIRGGVIRKGKDAKRFKSVHVLFALSSCENLVEGYLDGSIFCTSSNVDYNHKSESDLEREVSEKLGSQLEMQVLGVKKSYIVRLLRFSDVDSVKQALSSLQNFSDDYEFGLVTIDEIKRISLIFEDITVHSTDFL